MVNTQRHCGDESTSETEPPQTTEDIQNIPPDSTELLLILDQEHPDWEYHHLVREQQLRVERSAECTSRTSTPEEARTRPPRQRTDLSATVREEILQTHGEHRETQEELLYANHQALE